MLHPRPPIVIVSNGNETRTYATETGGRLEDFSGGSAALAGAACLVRRSSARDCHRWPWLEHDGIRRELEALSARSMGTKVMFIVEADTLVVDRLWKGETRRKETVFARRGERILVDRLDDNEFDQALEHVRSGRCWRPATEGGLLCRSEPSRSAGLRSGLDQQPCQVCRHGNEW